MARQILIFSPADAGLYPLRVAAFPQGPGSPVARGEILVRLEGPKGPLHLAAPLAGTVSGLRVLHGTTLETRTPLVALEVADDALPARDRDSDARPPKAARKADDGPPTGAPGSGDGPPSGGRMTGKGTPAASSAQAWPSARLAKRVATAAVILALLWWATPHTRLAISHGLLDPALLSGTLGRDAATLPARAAAGLAALADMPLAILAGDGPQGFRMADSGKASLCCTGKDVYFFAGSLFTGGHEIRSETDNGLATIEFDFSKRKACVQFGRILKYDDGTLHDDFRRSDCVGYDNHADAVELRTAGSLTADYAHDVRP